jgi:hypothetical protein
MNLTTKLLLGFGLSAGFLGYSQDLSKVNPVLTGAPFLRIAPDARSGGMGDQGVVTSPDAFSQFWNAAKYPFSRTSSSIGLNYTPIWENLPMMYSYYMVIP